MQSVIERIESVPGSCVLKQELSSSSITKIFLCIFNNVKSVIRFDLPAASQLGVDRQNEINILYSINHLDLAPQILYSDIKAGILIWKYISGSEPCLNQAKLNPNFLHDLGASLSLLHSFPIPKNSIDIFSNSMLVYQSLLESPSEKILFSKAMALYKKLEKDGTRKVFSHNDLHRKNILWDKKYYFLDWEYSGLNHPCFDIASLVKSFQLSQSQINELSCSYKANKHIFHMDTLNPWIQFIEYLEEIWEISVTKLVNKQEMKDFSD